MFIMLYHLSTDLVFVKGTSESSSPDLAVVRSVLVTKIVHVKRRGSA